MTPQFPFRCPYVITQGYSDDAGGNYDHPLDGHHHGALDIMPLQDGQPFPAPIYPTFDGSELSISDSDPIKGKGVRERVYIDSDLIAYCQSKGVLPNPLPTGNGTVVLDILYWHMLDVSDEDGKLDLDTPIGHAGNTGSVFHAGIPVPDNLKGVPPYLGLHLHYEHRLGTDKGVFFNLDGDPQGRINPQIILNYKSMNQAKVVKSKSSPTVYICYPVPSMQYLSDTANLQGIEVPANIPDTDSL